MRLDTEARGGVKGEEAATTKTGWTSRAPRRTLSLSSATQRRAELSGRSTCLFSLFLIRLTLVVTTSGVGYLVAPRVRRRDRTVRKPDGRCAGVVDPRRGNPSTRGAHHPPPLGHTNPLHPDRSISQQTEKKKEMQFWAGGEAGVGYLGLTK